MVWNRYLLTMTICGALPETNIASATLGLEIEFPFGQVWECILAKKKWTASASHSVNF